MNYIYLIVDKNNHMAKIGFTAKGLASRVYAYTTANPKAYVRDYCATYAKTGNTLERAAHAEMAKLGGKRLYALIDGKKTEWFDFEDQPETFQRIMAEGLQMFKVCKGRKCLGVYTK